MLLSNRSIIKSFKFLVRSDFFLFSYIYQVPSDFYFMQISKNNLTTLWMVLNDFDFISIIESVSIEFMLKPFLKWNIEESNIEEK